MNEEDRSPTAEELENLRKLQEIPRPPSPSVHLHPTQIEALKNDPKLGPYFQEQTGSSPQEPLPEALQEELRRRAHQLQAKQRLQEAGVRTEPEPRADMSCPEIVQVPGPHRGHHVHQLRQNRYECRECEMTFRFTRSGTSKRRRLLR
jgi:hypothetical protein